MALKRHLPVKGEFALYQISLLLLVISLIQFVNMVANFSEVQFLCSRKEKENCCLVLASSLKHESGYFLILAV